MIWKAQHRFQCQGLTSTEGNNTLVKNAALRSWPKRQYDHAAPARRPFLPCRRKGVEKPKPCGQAIHQPEALTTRSSTIFWLCSPGSPLFLLAAVMTSFFSASGASSFVITTSTMLSPLPF